MIIRVCDACHKEVESFNEIKIPCHLFSKRNELGYIDNGCNRVSGRSDVIQVCNKCSNRLYGAMVEKFDQLPAIEKAGAQRNIDRALWEINNAYQKIGEENEKKLG